MRLITDGVVDREGVPGLARRLGYTERHLHRLLVAEVGAGPLALARAQRAHAARLLIETTDLPLTEVAFAAGFGSVRQFNDTVRQVYGMPPSGLRARNRHRPTGADAAGSNQETITLRLAYRRRCTRRRCWSSASGRYLRSAGRPPAGVAAAARPGTVTTPDPPPPPSPRGCAWRMSGTWHRGGSLPAVADRRRPGGGGRRARDGPGAGRRGRQGARGAGATDHRRV